MRRLIPVSMFVAVLAVACRSTEEPHEERASSGSELRCWFGCSEEDPSANQELERLREERAACFESFCGGKYTSWWGYDVSCDCSEATDPAACESYWNSREC